MRDRSVKVSNLNLEAYRELLNKPQPEPEQPTKFAGFTDREILVLDLESGLTKEDARAIDAEMSRRGLYGN